MTTNPKSLPGFLRRSIRSYDDSTLENNNSEDEIEERLGGGVGSSSLIPPSKETATSTATSNLPDVHVMNSMTTSSTSTNTSTPSSSGVTSTSTSTSESTSNVTSTPSASKTNQDDSLDEVTTTVNQKFRLSPSTDLSDDSEQKPTPTSTDTDTSISTSTADTSTPTDTDPSSNSNSTSASASSTYTSTASSMLAGITSLTSYITSSSSINNDESVISPSNSYMSNTSNHSTNQSKNVQVQPKSFRELEFEKIIYPSSTSPTNATNTTTTTPTRMNTLPSPHVIDINALRRISWNGIPSHHRPLLWKILLGYLPTNSSRRPNTLKRKRAEYKDAIAQHYDIPDHSRTSSEQETLRQVLVDVPRTAPDVSLFRNELVRSSLTRLLYIWAMRHPASSYVQGINDLATPLVLVFLGEHLNADILENESVLEDITEEMMEMVEADVYWCLTNLLANIQDHYTSDQPGVQRMVMRLEELVHRMDKDLALHLQSTGVEFMQFAFRWMNCLLLREFDLRCVVRLWDTYLSEGDGGFERFHVYVCAAFLCQFSCQLREMQFDELFGFMQNIPTGSWGDGEIEILLSQAYVLSTLFQGSDAHLINANTNPY